MRIKLHNYYETEGFKADFEGGSNANTDSESGSPKSLKRASSVLNVRETPLTKRIKSPQSQVHPSINTPSQAQTIKAAHVSIDNPAEEEGETLRKSPPADTISTSADTDSHSSPSIVSTSQAETSSQILPSSSTTDKVATSNSREIVRGSDEGSSIGTRSVLDSGDPSNSAFLTSLRRTLENQLHNVSQLCETGTWSEESKKMVEDGRQTQERLLRAVSYACELEASLQTCERKLQTSEQKLQSSEQRCRDLEAKLGDFKKSYDQFNAIFRDLIS